MTAHQRWTQTDLTDLRRRLKDSATCAEIAAAVGRSPEMVLTMMKRLRLREVEPAASRERQ